MGLVAAGFGTAVFLRTALVDSLDAQLVSLARTDVAHTLLDFSVEEGLIVTPADSPPPTEYFVAVYDGSDGKLLAIVGGRGAPEPDFPAVLAMDFAKARELETFTLPSRDSEHDYLATRSVQEVSGRGTLYSQIVALPLAPADRTIANYIGIYTVLTLVIVLSSAFLTRWLVTLTFRGLGQVESTAMSIASGDFSQRMTDIEPRTEVGRLKIALNTMLDRVDGAISQRDATVRQMRRFIGDASHELRTPLVTVRGYAELYRIGAISDDEGTAQAMDRIEKEAIRMGVLVEDLLALARLDERRDVVFGPVDLRPIARDAALDVRATSPQRAVTVIDTTVEQTSADAAAEPVGPEPPVRRRPPATTPISRAGATLSLLRRRPRPVPASGPAETAALPPVVPVMQTRALHGLEPIVQGDENRIRQVVTNLLGNARRFTSEGSPIELRVGVDPRARMGWIEVADHGEGIPEQIRDKIFERFWRADNSRTRETGGTGLGLSIVASIVDALHGSVDVTETEGGGATFRVAFPLLDDGDISKHLLLETQPIGRLDRRD